MYSWQDKPITILGLSLSGCAAAKYLQHRGAKCFLSELIPASPANEEQRNALQALGVEVEMGGHSKKCFSHSHLVVASPGIPLHSALMTQLQLSGHEVISEVELAYRDTQQSQPPLPWVGITGTNGKTTVTSLISAILQAAGQYAPACGNIGLPILEVLDAPQRPIDTVVAELSSYQLTLSPTLSPKVAVLTNFKPDHLDWHGSLEAYRQAKLQLFTNSLSTDWAVIPAGDPLSKIVSQQSSRTLLWFSRMESKVTGFENKAYLNDKQEVVVELAGKPAVTVLSVGDLKLFGAHNHENVLAASATALLLDISPAVIRQACLAFEGVEHRLERVGSLSTATGAIAVFNDSKATNVDATLSALAAFENQKMVLIAGGRAKQSDLADLSPFVQAVCAKTLATVLMGEAADPFGKALETAGYQPIYATSLEDALNKAIDATALSTTSVPILFSPACASFDMFKNFEARGQSFKQAFYNLSTLAGLSQ